MSRYFWCDLPRHADAEIWRTAEIANKTRRHTNCPYGNNQKFSRLSAFFGTESLSSCVDCAPPSHSSLDATLWRALEACSAHVARVDRGRPCAMQSYAVGCVHRRHLLHRPPRPDPGRTFFTPVAFQNVSRSDGAFTRPPGRAPCRLRTTRTDAPRPTRIPYTSAGAPRASHDRPRTTDGRRARRTEVRPARKQTFPLAAPRHGSLEHILFLTPSPSPTASPASRSRHQPLTSPHSPHSRRETSSEACARAPPPRSRQARRGDLHRCAQRPPLFHPLNLQTSRWKRVPRLTLAPAGRLEPEGAAACVSTPGASATR